MRKLFTLVALLLGIDSIFGGFRSLLLTKTDDLDPPENLTLVFVGFRHGFRNPAQFLKNDTTRSKYGWGWEGDSQLTKIGKLQAYGLGKFLRKRYGGQLSADYFPSELKAQSSSADRCQMTLATVLAGLYEPTTNRSSIIPSLKWQPIPYQINDQLLRTYNLKCPAFTKAYKPIADENLPESVAWLKNKSTLVDYLAKNTGFNKSLSDLADLADNIASMRRNKVPLPMWLQKPSLSGYTADSLLSEVLKFGEAHQIQCAEKSDCARAMAGLWLNEILDQISKNNQKLALRLYASHTEAVLSLLHLMQAEIKEVAPSAGFILELDLSAAAPRVRLLKHYSTPENDENRTILPLKIPALKEVEKNWYNADDLVQLARPKSFDDWYKFCDTPLACWKDACQP